MVESEISSLDELKRELRNEAKRSRAEAAAGSDPEAAAYALCERAMGVYPPHGPQAPACGRVSWCAVR